MVIADPTTVYIDGTSFIVDGSNDWEGTYSSVAGMTLDGNNVLYNNKQLYYNGTAVLKTNYPQADGHYLTVSDLTGTKWVLGLYPVIPTASYNLSFSSNGSSYSTFVFQGNSDKIKYDADTAYNDELGGWQNEAYRIIEITGGTDATNTTLIGWLATYATQVPVADLTDTEWTIRDDAVNAISENASYTISFSSNSTNYSGISIAKSGSIPTSSWHIDYDNDETYNAIDGWANESYRTIGITGGTDVSDPDLLVWLTQNATMQETPEPEPTGVKNILFGTQAIDKILFGQSEVSKIYLGQTLVWQAESASVQTGIAVTVSNNQSATSPHIYDGADTTGTDLGTVASGETKTFYIESGYISMAHTEGVLWVFYPDNVAVVAVSEPVSLAVQQSGGSND